MNKLLLVIGIVVLATMPFVAGVASEKSKVESAVAGIPVRDGDVSDEIAQNLSEILAPVNSQVPIIKIRPSLMDGMFEVILANEQILYVNEAGTHFVVGDLFTMVDGGLANLSESGKQIARAEFNAVRKVAMDKVDPSTYIRFPATSAEKAVVTIFTDVDCPYCRKLHAEMEGYNALGITIQYAAYPRAGVGSKAYKEMVSAWCSEDRVAAIDALKRMKPIKSATCSNPVDMHLQLGEEVGVTGTPAIATEDGNLIPGYLPPAQLAAQLGII